MVVLALLDFSLKNRVPAALRYGFWLLLLVKLALPPTLSSPASAAYWLSAGTKQARPAPRVLTSRVEFTEVITPSIGRAAREPDTPPLRTHWYKIDPNTFASSLSDMLEGKSSSKPAGKVTIDSAIDLANRRQDRDIFLNGVLKLFNKAGVAIAPPKSVLFNERLGMLMVRATVADLDIIEQVIQVANAIPAQVVIQTRFVQVMEGEAASAEISKLLGFDIATRKGTTLSTAQPPNARTKAGETPTNLPPPAFTGILSPEQYRSVIAMLEPQKGAEFIASPSVIVPSGGQAQIKTVEIKTIVTDLDLDRPGGQPQPITEPIEFGSSLDVVPFVPPDGFTIQMTLIPSFREFVGYDLEISKQIGAAAGITNSIPLPVFRIRQAATSAIVRDGQTVVLGLGAAEAPSKIGGPAIQIRNPGVRMNLLVFITPTIVDPAGNRVHSEEEMASPEGRVPPPKPK